MKDGVSYRYSRQEESDKRFGSSSFFLSFSIRLKALYVYEYQHFINNQKTKKTMKAKTIFSAACKILTFVVATIDVFELGKTYYNKKNAGE